jgi:integrase
LIEGKRKKTGTDFVIPVGPEIIDLIDYFKKHPGGTFTNNVRSRAFIKTGSATYHWHRCDMLGRKLGFKVTESHKGRHTFAMNMINKEGWHISEVSLMLGHGSVKTTETFYGKVNKARIEKEVALRNAEHLTVTKMTGTD